MGVGADGVEYLTLGDNGGYSIRLFNADGTEGEISGNGTRCVAAYLAQDDDASEFSIRTHAGLRRCRILQRNAPRYLISTEMGVPKLKAHTVTLKDGTSVVGADVSIGNPHFVTFVDTPDFACARRPWQQVGAEICVHPDFPKGTNVEFVRVTDTNRIAFRIFERGVGPTLSSGTGSSASAVASIELRGSARTLTVVAEGGTQTVEWPQAGSSLMLTGPAEIIAQGECLLV
jgi:diaminopimelate epimerase